MDRTLRDEALLAEEQLTRTKGERMEEADGDMNVPEGCSWKIKVDFDRFKSEDMDVESRNAKTLKPKPRNAENEKKNKFKLSIPFSVLKWTNLHTKHFQLSPVAMSPD